MTKAVREVLFSLREESRPRELKEEELVVGRVVGFEQKGML